MKRLVSLVLLSLFFSLPVLAAGHSQDVTLSSTVQFGSSTLPAGDYKLTWTGSGDSAQVTLEKRGVPPATVSAQVVQEKHKDVSLSIQDKNGKPTITSIALRDIRLVF